MTYLSRAAVASASVLGSRPVVSRWGRVRAVTERDVALIEGSRDARALTLLRAGITERASGGLAGAAAAFGAVALLAVVGFALYPPSESSWGWLVALVLLVIAGTVVTGTSFDAEPRLNAWCFLLDRRIRQLDASAGGGHGSSVLSRLTRRAPRT